MLPSTLSCDILIISYNAYGNNAQSLKIYHESLKQAQFGMTDSWIMKAYYVGTEYP